MIASAALLMRERGVEATSFSDVIARAPAPRGSIYHHFPGGKAELIEEATRYAGDVIAAGLAAALGDEEPDAALRLFATTWREVIRESDFSAGCPVVAATLEGERNPEARAAAAAAFSGWVDLLATALEGRGVDRERARSLATLCIAAIEGAIVLARADRSAAPLERVTDELEGLISDAL
jgi:AcrR family transcriptional regulator